MIYMYRCHDLLLRSGLCLQKSFANLAVCPRVHSSSWCVFALAAVTAGRNPAHLVRTPSPRPPPAWHGRTVQGAFVRELNHLTEPNAWGKDRQEAALLCITSH